MMDGLRVGVGKVSGWRMDVGLVLWSWEDGWWMGGGGVVDGCGWVVEWVVYGGQVMGGGGGCGLGECWMRGG